MVIKQFFLSHIKEFIPIYQKLGQKHTTKVFLEKDEITSCILLINLQPVLFAICLAVDNPLEKRKITYQIDGTIIANISIQFIEQVEGLLIFKPIHTKLFKLSYYQRFVELPKILHQSKKSKFKFTKNTINHLISWYLYPRKIYVVVVMGADFLNIFPMDLHVKCPNSNNYYFALQPSNLSELCLKQNKKIVVCELAAKDIIKAYSLGKNHGGVNLFNSKLPFDCIKSKNFKFVIPKFCIGYKEVEITSYKLMGTHTLFQGNVVFVKHKNVTQQPYHVHRFFYNQYLKLTGIRLHKL